VNIAIDYDNTFTLDPPFWRGFIMRAVMAGHKVLCVTMRHDSMPVEHEMSVPVHYTGHKAKRPFMEAQGIHIDVWIDDMPEFVCVDAAA
jgi:hypothetical protein